ncbi:MAG: hypothetical protein ROO76_02375 [Terriglobia bacterium]|nr:hypothetical protein [Terriglobia bacterium]
MALSNDKVELIVLAGGGNLASFRFAGRGPNLLFESPWTTIDPQNYHDAPDPGKHGPACMGKFLSGFTGHALALGYYGPPSKAGAQQGLPYNGEAAGSVWQVKKISGGSSAKLAMEVRLPAGGLSVAREIELRAGESFARIRETVTNEHKAENFFQWVQCATFGEPLLAPKVSIVSIPGFRGQTSERSFDGHDLLAKNQQFRWPVAASVHGGSCDLRQAFHQEGRGYEAAVLLDMTRDRAFVAVFNPELRIGAGYSFPRENFPWVALWEDNRARTTNPWNGMTRARGLEFGTSPFPTGLAPTIFDGPLFETRTLTSLDAGASVTVDYRLFAAEVPPAWEAIGDVREDGDQVIIRGTHRSESVRI